MGGHRLAQRRARARDVLEDKLRLGHGRRLVVGLDAVGLGQRLDLDEQTPAKRPRGVGFSSDEPHGRGIDAGEVAARALIDAAVRLGRRLGARGAPVAVGAPPQVLLEPSAERRDVLVVLPAEAELGVARDRRVGRPRARQRHHRAVLEPFVPGVLLQGARRRVVCAQHHAARLEAAHQRPPLFDSRRGMFG